MYWDTSVVHEMTDAAWQHFIMLRGCYIVSFFSLALLEFSECFTKFIMVITTWKASEVLKKIYNNKNIFVLQCTDALSSTITVNNYDSTWISLLFCKKATKIICGGGYFQFSTIITSRLVVIMDYKLLRVGNSSYSLMHSFWAVNAHMFFLLIKKNKHKHKHKQNSIIKQQSTIMVLFLFVYLNETLRTIVKAL
jgi:hypothetical protein